MKFKNIEEILKNLVSFYQQFPNCRTGVNILKKIDHTRRRSPVNFISNLLFGLIAYYFRGNKPRIDLAINFNNSSFILD